MPILTDLGLSRGRAHSLQRSFASGLRLPGTSGNYVSTPDSVLNSVTGDIDIRVYAKLDDWTPAATNGFVSKRDTGQNSYELRLTTAGALEFAWAQDGSTIFTSTATISVAFTDGTSGWVRATLDVDNGSGQNVTTFYTSVDGITWTALGTPVTKTGVSNIFDGTSLLRLGTRDSSGSTDMLAGTIYYAEVRNGIDGPIAAQFDSSQVAASGAQTPATINGWTWNGAALYKRDDYVRFPGAATNVLNYPDVANVYGDIDLRIHLSVDNTASTYALLCKSQTSGQASWRWRYVNNTMEFGYYFDGTTIAATIGSTALGVVAGTPIWLRVTRTKSTGIQVFYTSSDGVTWATISTSGAADAGSPLFDGNSPLELGARFNATDPLAGNVYYAEVRNGINGTVVASWDGRIVQTPWTVNGAAWNWEGSSFVGKPAVALSLPGTVGNYVSTPDTAGNSITSDIDIRIKLAMDSWTAAGFRSLVSKYVAAGNQKAYRFGLNADGSPGLAISPDGSTDVFGGSTIFPFTNGQTYWIRFTWVDSTNVYVTYYSLDGVTWTQNNTATMVSAGIFDSTAPIEIGSTNAGANVWSGKVYYAEVRNSIDGPIVAMFDPVRMAKTGTRTPASTVQPGGSPNMLMPNQASIETDASGWAVRGNCTIAQDATQFLDGTKSLSLTSVAAGDMSAETLTGTSGVPVVSGKSYTVVGSTRAATTLRQFSVLIQWYNAAGASISTSFAIVPLNNSTSAWTSNFVTAVAPAGAVYAAAGAFIIATGAAAEVHYVDRISLVEAANVWTINGAAWDLVVAS